MKYAGIMPGTFLLVLSKYYRIVINILCEDPAVLFLFIMSVLRILSKNQNYKLFLKRVFKKNEVLSYLPWKVCFCK